jgi:hypothetical protein
MRVKDCVSCAEFPCADVRHECYAMPDIKLETDKISVMLISEDIAAALSLAS